MEINMERLLETVLENAHKVGNVVVVGAGRRIIVSFE